MLLMQRLARVEDRQLIVEEPRLGYQAMANTSYTQWQIIPSSQCLPTEGDIVISCLLQSNAILDTAGIAWGFAETGSGHCNRFVYNSGTGTWQVAHSHIHKPFTIHSMRGRIQLPSVTLVRMAVLYLQQVCYFYLGSLHTPVYQCTAMQMPRHAAGIGLCTMGHAEVSITDLRAWQLTTQPQHMLSIESLVDPGFAD